METLASRESASPDTELEFHLIRERDRTDDWRRWRKAAIVSLAVHGVLIVALLLMPESMTTLPVYEAKPLAVVTPLYIPTDLTQKEPNKGKLSKEISVEAVAPRPLVKEPSPPPPAKRVPASAPLPPPQVAKSEPKLVITEPPKLQADAANAPQDPLAKLNAAGIPPPDQQPKLVFENVVPPSGSKVQGNPQAKVTMPDTSINAVVRDLPRTAALGTQSVEIGGGARGTGLGINSPPSLGQQVTHMELKSDAMGVDFRPYLTQIIQTIRRNWFAVYPEAARLGQRGETVIGFRIAKQGLVAKVTFSGESGSKALDEAAVAAISASNPLPPLPRDFKGNQIDLELTFKYNMPK